MAKKPAEDDAQPWERQPKETAEAFEAFVLYRNMEGRRSTRGVAQTLLKSDAMTRRWSSVHQWVSRALSWDEEVDRVACAKFLEKVAERAETHAAIGRSIYARAVKRLETVKPEKLTTEQAVHFATLGIKLEREALELDRVRRDRQQATRNAERAILREEAARQARGITGATANPSRRPWRVTVIGAEGKDPAEVLREAVNMYFDKPQYDEPTDEPLIQTTTEEDDDADY